MTAYTSLRPQRRDALLQFLQQWPTGVTIDEVEVELGCPPNAARRAVRDLRLYLGDTADTMTVIATPQGSRDRWLYTLESTMDASRGWVTNRIGDAESRVETLHAVAASLVAATDGRTRDGQVARLVELYSTRIIQDIAMLDGRMFP